MLHRSGTSALLLARHAAGSPSLRLSLFSGDGQRTQPSGLSGMGLINREKRQHAWPARTMAPPTFACAGVRAPRCSLVRCPSHQRPQTSGHPGALAHTCFPKVAALGPEASDSAPPRPERALTRLLGPVNGVGGLTAVRKLRAPSLSTPPQLPAAFSTVSCGANLQTELASNPTSHPWHWTANTELPVHQARRCLHLRAPRKIFAAPEKFGNFRSETR